MEITAKDGNHVWLNVDALSVVDHPRYTTSYPEGQGKSATMIYTSFPYASTTIIVTGKMAYTVVRIMAAEIGRNDMDRS